MPANSLFRQQVLRVVAKIPRGRVLTYGEVARRAGSPRAARAVGTILSQNFDQTIPCHRVVKSDGMIGEYNRGKERKQQILLAEGVKIRGERVIFDN